MPIPISIVVVAGSSEHRSGKIIEIGDDGIFIATNSLWPPGTPLTLVMTLPGERVPLRVSGNVAWARTRDVAGMFLTLTEPAEHPIRELKLRWGKPPAAPRSVAAGTE